MTLLLKAVLIGLLLALAEMVNGTIRVRMLTRQLGKQRAGRVGFPRCCDYFQYCLACVAVARTG